MAGVATDECGVGRYSEGSSSRQNCLSGEALAEWRSSEQVENGTPSTSLFYWDSDNGDGPKPSELYGKYTWKIENFSQINKRELRSNAFEVGGYKWYILIYPQGCDVCNHLSLFLCVADHDKLLPGWSHFAQFTIAVVNKDPKKSKYSDTLHRFWKKEHDWGWKKFMELSKVYDGFIESDTLIIKAQVQVIRAKVDQPFRCLDHQYRRELVRVYLTNVEQICHRFLDDRRSNLGKFIEDKAKWSSFCAFWLGIDQNSRRRMSREKKDMILKVVVKHFFIEKEVTSTLVMDSLYSGLKALEGRSKIKKAKSKLLDAEEMPAPIVCMEKDMFVLVDDVLLLLERAVLEPLPPKDEKGPQNRKKDGNSGEDFNKDSIEHDERHLIELGHRTVEIFVLSHIFSNKIEVAYQEAVALQRQEELIREEAAWLAESEQKTKRVASEKEKKAKKKQAKQKRNNRKGKDKRREKAIVAEKEKQPGNHPDDDKETSIIAEVQPVPEKSDVPGDVSDLVDGATEVLQPDSEDRDASPVNWDTDTSEAHPPTEASSSGITVLSCVSNGVADNRSIFIMDDSSSTCSTDSVPSVIMNGHYKWNSFSSNQNKKSPSRGKNHQSKISSDGSSWSAETNSQTSCPTPDARDHNDVSENSKAGESESEAAASSLLNQTKWTEEDSVTKEEVDLEKPKEKIAAIPSSPRGLPINLPPSAQFRSEYRSASSLDSIPVSKAMLNTLQQRDHPSSSNTSFQMAGISKSEFQKAAAPKPADKPMTTQVPVVSRPSSAPLIPRPRPTGLVVSMVQTTPFLARSVSAAGRLGPDPSPATRYVPQSYRNAIMGNHVASSSSGFTHPNSPSSVVNPLPAYLQPAALVSASVYIPKSSDRVEPNSAQSCSPFGMATKDTLPNAPQWLESYRRDGGRSNPSLLSEIQNLDLYNSEHNVTRERIFAELPASTSQHHTQGVLGDEFPHLDIINDLLDEEHNVGGAVRAGSGFHSLGYRSHLLNQQFSFPSNLGMSGEMGPSSGECRFDRAWSFHDDGFQQGYSGSSGNHFDTPRDFILHASPLPYANGQIGGLVPTQWPTAFSDLSSLGMRNAYGDSYPYYSQEYFSPTCDVNGYTVFRPSNGC
ncbi:TNF receptor-associated factor homolog 1b-like isoform X2 [Hibiscus syriacus]|uniref:TNF receptor-associated factor homolog 1b-like isoform X2 n=1 Tax=Hibiscus syriacus TaxID=106335 RepID=UPI001921F337|nr:TNF receptor-associated factor homolog 1b-like isoform X2 [Hibiscus syriacus]